MQEGTMKEVRKRTEEYLEMLSLSVQKGEPFVTPLTASLQANKWCNSKCEYCGIWKNPANNPPAEDLILAVDELAQLGIKMISLTGGEPFLQSHLSQIIRRMETRGIVSSTMTNGLLLKPKYVIPILEAGLNSLCVSLDTIDPCIYKKIRGVPLPPVLNGLRYVSRLRHEFPSLVVFSINCVVSRANINLLIPLIEFANELDISVGLQPLHNSFESTYNPDDLQFREDDLSLIQREMKKIIKMKQDGYRIDNDWEYLEGFPDYLIYRRLPQGTKCTAGFTTISIDVDLNVKSCWPMKPVGNLRTQSLTDIWYSEIY